MLNITRQRLQLLIEQGIAKKDAVTVQHLRQLLLPWPPALHPLQRQHTHELGFFEHLPQILGHDGRHARLLQACGVFHLLLLRAQMLGGQPPEQAQHERNDCDQHQVCRLPALQPACTPAPW